MKDTSVLGVWVCEGCVARGYNPFWVFERRPGDSPGMEIEGDCSACRNAAADLGQPYVRSYLRYLGTSRLAVDVTGEAVQPERSEPSGEA